MSSYCKERENLIKRLRRIEGQVRGIQRMIEEEKYCIDIMNQVTAARAALKSVGLKILNSHIQGCVRDVLEKNEDNEEIIQELLNVISRFSD